MIRIPRGKGGKAREVPLSFQTAPETCLCHIKLAAINIQFPDNEAGHSRIVE